MNKKATEFDTETIRSYLKDPYHCPHCGNNEDWTIDWGPPDAEVGSQVVRTAICTDCDNTWRENYVLTGIEPGLGWRGQNSN